ncbi:MAG: MCE family protein [Alphaproteobacteria bacterium]|jgi:phospholipid/cholesterol/gamma-HCH transport system substrate-binding protein|nr:MCE family protein [Alphaproteobacteria bacterium]
METRASYIAVGAFVLLVALGLAVFLVWLGAGSLQQERDLYRIFFSGSVTGLQEGSAVRYRGVPVGAVESIRINPENLEEIEVRVALEPGTPIVTDNVARLDLQGLAGGAYILISGGSESAPPLVRAPGEPPPVIESVPAPLERLYTSVPDLIDQANRVLNRAENFLSEENARALTETAAEIRELTQVLGNDRTGLPAVLARVEGLAVSLEGLTTEARVDVARLSDRLDTSLETATDQLVTLSGDVQVIATDLQQLAATYRTVGTQVSALLSQSRPGIAEFTQTGLYEFTLMTSELRGLAESLTRLVNRFERDPAQFLLGDTSSGVELD